MTDDAIRFNRDEGRDSDRLLAQGVYEIGFVFTPESALNDAPHVLEVGRLFRSDRRHCFWILSNGGFQCAQPIVAVVATRR